MGRNRAHKVASKSLRPEERSLAVFAISLQGTDIIVELRDDTIVRGRLETCDAFMKCAPRGGRNPCCCDSPCTA